MIFLLCVKKAGELKWSVNCIHAEPGLGRLVKGHSHGLDGFLCGVVRVFKKGVTMYRVAFLTLLFLGWICRALVLLSLFK